MAYQLFYLRHRIKHQKQKTMRTFIFLTISLFSIAFLGSCVESSQKYKSALAKIDSLQAISNTQGDEMERNY